MGKAIVTGSSGLLGRKLMGMLNEKFNCIGVSKSGVNGLKTDVSTKEIIDLILKEKPEIIFHTAALSDVDYCELNRKEAWNTNVQGTMNVLKGAEEVEAKLIYVSTDFVFDGGKGMYNEEDEPNPINYYGETKLEGEKIILNSSTDFIIARPSVLYGANQKKKFVAWVINSLKNENNIRVVDDHFNSPTLVDNLAEILLRLIDKKGIFHTSGSERISRYEFALKIADIFGLDKSLITPIKTEQLKQVAKRPKDSSLDVGKIRDMGIKSLNIEEGLKGIKER